MGPMRNSLRVSSIAATLLVLTSGCGLIGSGNSGDDDKAADDKPVATETIDPDRISPDDLPDVPEIKDPTGAVKDVKIGDCPTKKGKNKVTGSLKNPTDAAQDYVITISWITPRSDVVARGVATVKAVAGGASEKFTITGSAIASDGTYSCTTNVVRGAL